MALKLTLSNAKLSLFEYANLTLLNSISPVERAIVLVPVSISASLSNVVKESIPPGHTWGVTPIVNNTTKELTFTPSYSSNTSIELRGNGIRWSGKVDIVYSERNY